MNEISFEDFKVDYENAIKQKYPRFMEHCLSGKSNLPLEYQSHQEYLSLWKPFVRLNMLNILEEEREAKVENTFSIITEVKSLENGFKSVDLLCYCRGDVDDPVELVHYGTCISGLSFQTVKKKSSFDEMKIACNFKAGVESVQELSSFEIRRLINENKEIPSRIQESSLRRLQRFVPLNVRVADDLDDKIKEKNIVYMNVLASYYVPTLHDRNLDRMACDSFLSDHFFKPKVCPQENISADEIEELNESLVDLSIDRQENRSRKDLNKFQEKAMAKVMECLENDDEKNILQILGPPGSGKTHTIVKILERVFNRNQRSRVLVCTPSNAAVDVILIRAKNAPTFEYSLGNLISLHRLGNIRKMDNQVTEYKPKTVEQYMAVANGHSSIVFATLNSCQPYALSNRIEEMSFDLVIIDEAGQSSEVETLMPFAYNCKTFVLVGDHKQLRPTIKSQLCSRLGYERSFFERYQIIKDRDEDKSTVGLWQQYRMKPEICNFPSMQFYGGELQTNEGSGDNSNIKLSSITFFDLLNTKEYNYNGSKSNISEATFIVSILEHILKETLEYEQKMEKRYTDHSDIDSSEEEELEEILEPFKPNIGIICFYKAQIGLITKKLKEVNLLRRNIKVDTVDSFQGQEQDIIIISCSRSNPTGQIGFADSPNRLNVAITRAKSALIIVGNRATFNNNPMWRDMFTYYEEHSRIFSVDSREKDFDLYFEQN